MKLIKLLLVNIVMIFILMIAEGQEIRIAFCAAHHGACLKTDSILVKNITRSCDTLLLSPDTVLLLRQTIGINDQNPDLENIFDLKTTSQNPADGNSGFVVSCLIDLNFTVSVANLTGKSLFSKVYHGTPGGHHFSIMAGNEEMLIVSVKVHGVTKSLKQLFVVKNQLPFKLIYNGVKENTCKNNVKLSDRNFHFILGDSLIFTGYATIGIAVGSDVASFSPITSDTVRFDILEGKPCPGSELIRYEGQTYQTVQIRNQCWMKENLNVGIRIDHTNQQTYNGIIEKYCFDDLEENCSIYGGMYNWYEMGQINNAIDPMGHGICPEGWRPPTHDDWYNLINPPGYETGARSIKIADTLYWLSPNDATNETGFSAIAGGYCDATGLFSHLKFSAQFWSSGYNFNPHLMGGELWYMFSDSPIILSTIDQNPYFGARSVRCIRE